MEHYNANRFMELSAIMHERYSRHFEKLLEKNRRMEDFLKRCIGEINTRLTDFQNKNQIQTRILLLSNQLYDDGEGANLGEAIAIFCSKRAEKSVPNILILAHLRTLYRFRDHIIQMIAVTNPKDRQTKKRYNSPYPKREKEIDISDLTLLKLIGDSRKCDYVVGQLTSKEYCDSKTLHWLPQGKGNLQKLSSLLYALRSKKYFTSIYPGPKHFQKVALNSFGVNISLSTLKNKNYKKFSKEFDFLKPFSEGD